ncbi:autoinducer binding domain-containing protein [Sinorhizobium sp. BG8]|uniref:helix-turn-helix transcriptional regulator n=1 Tax=Sinorhizobium sp. BG8 TaxID=2613773 RepID=UPI00193D51A9|nr:autoinducer binding domain-containing protein [Sinorhizobium sp. BG8]
MDLVLAGLGPLSFFAGRQKSSVCSILNRCRGEVGARHVAHVYLQRAPGQEETYISVTYPGRWLLNYAIRNYFSVDPVIRDDERPTSIRILNHVEESGWAVRAMLADAQSFGIGRSFVEIQVMPHSEYRGTVMFAFDIEPTAITKYIERKRELLLEAALQLHVDTLKARGLMPDTLELPELNCDETRCVSMLADGRTYAEIGEAMSWSEQAVIATLNDLCERLGCANPLNLVARCISQGWLRDFDDGFTPPPLSPLSTRVFPAKPH